MKLTERDEQKRRDIPPTVDVRRLPAEAGVWLFICLDLLVFSYYFLVFMHDRAHQPELFRAGRMTLHPGFGLAYTLLLVTASWFVAYATRRVRIGATAGTPRLFLVGIACAICFIAVKVFEYHQKFAAGLTVSTSLFFTYYFVFTSIHLAHVVLGIGALSFAVIAAGRADPAPTDIRNIESCATFWHLVDLLWIAIFALLYLVD